jgi:hypothetical protein
MKVRMDSKTNVCTNLSSDSFSNLLSSASGKLSWPATTVLLLEVVPVHGIRWKILRERCMQKDQAQDSSNLGKDFLWNLVFERIFKSFGQYQTF